MLDETALTYFCDTSKTLNREITGRRRWRQMMEWGNLLPLSGLEASF